MLSLLFSALALAGGPSGATLCLEKAGSLHPGTAAAHEEHAAAPCACDEECMHQCEGCLDVEVKGLDLAQLRFDDAGGLLLAPPAVTALIPAQERGRSRPLVSGDATGDGPPGKVEALIVAQTSVLLL